VIVVVAYRQLIEYVKKQHAYYWYLLTILFCFSIFTIWFIGAFVRAEKRLDTLKLNVSSLKYQSSTLGHLQADVSKLSNKLNMLEISARDKAPKSDKTLGENIDFIFTLANQSGLIIGRCLPAAEKNRTWYSVYKILFNFNGSFQEIQTFFDGIRLSDRLVRFSDVSINKSDNDDDNLKVACILNFYTVDRENMREVS